VDCRGRLTTVMLRAAARSVAWRPTAGLREQRRKNTRSSSSEKSAERRLLASAAQHDMADNSCDCETAADPLQRGGRRVGRRIRDPPPPARAGQSEKWALASIRRSHVQPVMHTSVDRLEIRRFVILEVAVYSDQRLALEITAVDSEP